MAYLLIPHNVSAQTATVWIGAINEPMNPPPSLILDQGHGQINVDPASWTHESFGGRTLSYQRVPLENLRERTRYPLRLLKGGQLLADAGLTTLPPSLPSDAEKPFTVFLGSCFCELQDQGGSAGATYFNLPTGARPDIKILCGDQVYLDAPWHHYLRFWPFSGNELEARFFDTYCQAWTQSGAASGFNQLLKNGANYFAPDDHEFWNNAPNKAAYVRNSWTSNGREEWFKLAHRLYDMFQSAKDVPPFDVSPLSFFIADTRTDRTPDRAQLMRPSTFYQLSNWIGALKGPGVLVVGQPIFAKSAGFMGRFTDWNFPDYKQYPDLVRAISTSKKPIILLTGDVHFGRISRTVLPSGTTVLEIISSPLSLVDKSSGGKWEPAPPRFPADPVPGLTQTALQTDAGHQMTGNHFLTLEFTAVGNRVKLVVKMWPIAQAGVQPIPINVTQPILL